MEHKLPKVLSRYEGRQTDLVCVKSHALHALLVALPLQMEDAARLEAAWVK